MKPQLEAKVDQGALWEIQGQGRVGRWVPKDLHPNPWERSFLLHWVEELTDEGLGGQAALLRIPEEEVSFRVACNLLSVVRNNCTLIKAGVAVSGMRP